MIAPEIRKQAWRFSPDTFAQKASGGRWKPYRHLVHASDVITHAILRGGGRVIFEVPPRHGKSEFVSHWVPTWYFDLWPENRVILTSYADSLARFFGRKVRNELESNPHVSTRLPKDKTAAGNFETREGGGLITAGIGGPITGRGADLCFPKGVYIHTSSGYKDISNAKPGDLVWSFDHKSEKLELCKIEKVSSRYVSRLVRVSTASGRRIISTPEHPFFTKELGYQEAQDLGKNRLIVSEELSPVKNHVGGASLRDVRQRIQKAKVWFREGASSWAQRILLLKSMFKKTSQLQKQAKVRDLRNPNGKEVKKVLLGTMSAEDKNKNFKEPISESLSIHEGSGFFQGFIRVLRVWISSIFDRPSHQRDKNGRSTGESSDSMQIVSCEAPPIKEDTVEFVEKIGGKKVRVFNVQVERNHNFFADGILVHNCIIDDPIKNMEEAISEGVRNRHIEWFKSTLYTRLEPNATVIVLMTRWHENDLAGWLMENHEDRWEEIRLPAIAEADDPMKRPEGEALCPERYDAGALQKIQRAVGTRAWNALYQGRPAPIEGECWKRSHWRRYTKLPDSIDEWIQSWDLTFKKESSSWVVGQVWARKDANKYLAYQIRGKWGFNESLDKIRLVTALYPDAMRKLIEAKANGSAVEDTLQKEIPGIILVEPHGGKLARALAVEPEIESGNVYLPADELGYDWVDGFIEEAAAFPNGSDDDQVDAASQALKHFDSGGIAFGTKKRQPTRRRRWAL